ncbi:hypothetical protein APHAL10511_005027 [Amanita phalloides]|nr:hypothetical protein APHAL10511_005027 [Amanita phalloides]
MNKFFATAIAIISLVPAIASLAIDTPASMTQCQPTLFTWNGGTGPYFLSILPGGQIGAAPLVSLGQTGDTSQTWVVTLPPNAGYTVVLKDSTGQQAFTDQIMVLPSNDQSCMNETGNNNAASSVAVGTATGAAGAAHATPAASGAVQASASKASAHPSAAASNVSNSGIMVGAGSFGLVSLLGLVGVVLF